MTNMDKLYEAVAARGPVCVGLDTEFGYLPETAVDPAKTAGENIVAFNPRPDRSDQSRGGLLQGADRLL